MTTLHIAPGYSAGGSLRRMLLDAGLVDEVLAYFDDLSHGPLMPDDLSVRAAWWARIHDGEGVERELAAFWQRAMSGDRRLVVWFARHSARELAFFLAWADHLGDRPYHIIDATALELPYGLAPSVSVIPPHGLQTFLGKERPITAPEVEDARQAWQRLKAENAPFRVVTPDGLVSVPLDRFDAGLLESVGPGWRKVAAVVGDAMAKEFEPYLQVGDLMLVHRVIALVEEGRLIADGDPLELHQCRVHVAS